MNLLFTTALHRPSFYHQSVGNCHHSTYKSDKLFSSSSKLFSSSNNYNNNSSNNNNNNNNMPLPQTIVFDLDDCLWSPEMYTLSSMPTSPVTAPLHSSGVGVVGVRSGSSTVRLFPEALSVLQRVASGEYEGVTFALASSSEEPAYSNACLEALEVLPGVKMSSLFPYRAIGRTGELTSRKTTHFKSLKRQFPEMDYKRTLFFDDCNWGDHVGDLNTALGVKGIRTPNGLTVADFEEVRRERKADTQGGTNTVFNNNTHTHTRAHATHTPPTHLTKPSLRVRPHARHRRG